MTIFASLNAGKPQGGDLADISIIAGRLDNIENGLLGVTTLNSVSITGGSIINAVVGISTNPVSVYSNTTQTDNILIDGNTVSSTDTNGNINLEPNGTGKVISTKKAQFAELNTTPIGLTTPSTGAFTTITGTSIATGGNGAMKMDIITTTVNIPSNATTTITIAHGKSTNIRGTSMLSIPAADASVSAITLVRSNATNVVFDVTVGGNNQGTIPVYCTVFYV